MRLLLALIACLSAAPALAQEPVANGSQFGNWVVRCEAVSTQQTACRVQQTLSVAETGQVILNLIALPREEGAALLLAQVPMGVYLPGGAVFRPTADTEAPQRTMVWQRCAGQICEAATQLSAEDLTAMTDAGSHLFGYTMNPGAEPIIVDVDTSTLAEAIAAIAG